MCAYIYIYISSCASVSHPLARLCPLRVLFLRCGVVVLVCVCVLIFSVFSALSLLCFGVAVSVHGLWCRDSTTDAFLAVGVAMEGDISSSAFVCGFTAHRAHPLSPISDIRDLCVPRTSTPSASSHALAQALSFPRRPLPHRLLASCLLITTTNRFQAHCSRSAATQPPPRYRVEQQQKENTAGTV